jgi:C-terminal processing protease CtpA/Prc
MNRTFLLALTLGGLLLAAVGQRKGWFQRPLPAGQRASNTVTAVDLAISAKAPVTNVMAPNPAEQSIPTREAEEIVGIGAALAWNKENRCPEIRNVIPLSPAAIGGLAPGWLISKIDDTPTTSLNLKECVSRLRGSVGSKVQLEVIHLEDSATNTVELIRQKLRL